MFCLPGQSHGSFVQRYMVNTCLLGLYKFKVKCMYNFVRVDVWTTTWYMTQNTRNGKLTSTTLYWKTVLVCHLRVSRSSVLDKSFALLLRSITNQQSDILTKSHINSVYLKFGNQYQPAKKKLIFDIASLLQSSCQRYPVDDAVPFKHLVKLLDIISGFWHAESILFVFSESFLMNQLLHL